MSSLVIFTRAALAARRYAIVPLAAVSVAMFAAVPGRASDLPLTLGQAQQLAVARSQQLSAQDQAISAACEMAVAAGQRPDPVLKFGVDNLPVSGADKFSLTRDFMTMRRIGVMQEITRHDKLNARTQRYTHSAEKAVADQQVAIAAIQRDTALAWLERFYAEQIDDAVRAQVDQARSEVQAAESAYRAGRGSQADIFTARALLVAIEDRKEESARRVRNARTMLSRWSGVAPEIALAGGPATDHVDLDLAALDTALDHHPQFAALRSQEAVARAEADLALANRKSDWSVEVAFQQRGPEFSNMVSVGLSLPLQWDAPQRQERELHAKLALVQQASSEREELLRTHVADIRTMQNDWQTGRARQVRYQTELLPLAAAQVQAVLGAYRGGKASLTEVLAARRNALDVQQQALALQGDTAKLWAQLRYLFPDQSTLPANLTAAQHSETNGGAPCTNLR